MGVRFTQQLMRKIELFLRHISLKNEFSSVIFIYLLCYEFSMEIITLPTYLFLFSKDAFETRNVIHYIKDSSYKMSEIKFFSHILLKKTCFQD